MADMLRVYAAREDDGYTISLHETLEGAKAACEGDWAGRPSSLKPKLDWDESNPFDVTAHNPTYHGATVYRISQMTVQE